MDKNPNLLLGYAFIVFILVLNIFLILYFRKKEKKKAGEISRNSGAGWVQKQNREKLPGSVKVSPTAFDIADRRKPMWLPHWPCLPVECPAP